ncbi:MAG: prepilin-type N-terminal cleavage/methylation domain-containing protein [Myxococcales bacterium]|nr:prepilin-type N-terminal cleavage/methylation domain-containing protein [Myxococcales bacterium]
MFLPRCQPRSRPGRLAAFTLIELMIVVAIIGVVAALAAPSITTGLRERKPHQAALDLVRLVRRARSESAAYGRAHLLRYSAIGSAGRGLAQVYRGTNGRCATNDWDAILAGGCAGNTMCIDALDPAVHSSSAQDVRMRVVGANPLDICFESTGLMRHRRGAGVAGGPFSDRNDIGGGFRFTFQQVQGGTPVGTIRYVLVPLGSDARVLR